jgi:hypothetical protein
MLISAYKNWRQDRVVFPLKWLSYKQRIRNDVERLFVSPDGKTFFDEPYCGALEGSIKQLQDWYLKLLSLQTAISVFIIIGFISDDASISLLGITLKQAAGVKEVVLAVSVTFGLVTLVVSFLVETRVAVIEKLIILKTKPEFHSLALLRAPAMLHFRVYITQPYAEWMFPIFLSKVLMGAQMIGFFVLFLCAFVASIVITVYLFMNIYIAPTLGIWSYAILGYAALAYLTSLIAVIVLHCPLPYRDKSELLEVARLKETDPTRYDERIRKLFGKKVAQLVGQ